MLAPAVVRVLASRGVEARFRGHAKEGAEPFLCFGRGDPRDLVIGEDKVLGSAQRRRKGAILQHGSLVLRASEAAPAIRGIADLVPAFDATDLDQALAESIAPVLGATQRPVPPPVADGASVRIPDVGSPPTEAAEGD